MRWGDIGALKILCQQFLKEIWPFIFR
jgi:hypothetical protein